MKNIIYKKFKRSGVPKPDELRKLSSRRYELLSQLSPKWPVEEESVDQSRVPEAVIERWVCSNTRGGVVAQEACWGQRTGIEHKLNEFREMYED